eukprot:416898_1
MYSLSWWQISIILYMHTLCAYKFSPILVNFNEAISHCRKTYNFSLATIFTSQQNQIVSTLCSLNGNENCWIGLNKRSIIDAMDNKWYWLQEQTKPNFTQWINISNAGNCVEIISNINGTHIEGEWNMISCHVLRHPICNDNTVPTVTLSRSSNSVQANHHRTLLQNPELMCTSFSEDNSTCYVDYKEFEDTWIEDDVICNPMYPNCIVTVHKYQKTAIHCPSRNCINCIINITAKLHDSTVYGYNCQLLRIKVDGWADDNQIFAPANGGTLLVTDVFLRYRMFDHNRIYSSYNDSGTENIVINMIHGWIFENTVNGSYVTGDLNFSCSGDAECTNTNIICNKNCQINCSSTFLAGACRNMNIFAFNGTSDIDWHCQKNLSKICSGATLSCQTDVGFNMSPWKWQYNIGWYYDTFDCVVPIDYFNPPPISCSLTTTDSCIIIHDTNGYYYYRDIQCDGNYQNCQIEILADNPKYPTNIQHSFKCPNETCISCIIHCYDTYTCSYATIYGYNCKLLEINVQSTHMGMTIYAPGNGGELRVLTHDVDGKYVSFYGENYIYSVPGTKGILVNFDETMGAKNMIVNGTHVTEYLNISCKGYGHCQYWDIICPIAAICNIECSPSITGKNCRDMKVYAMEGSHDVNWFCNDNPRYRITSCIGSNLYCGKNFSKSSEMYYDDMDNKWKLDNNSDGCLNPPTTEPTTSPTSPTVDPTELSSAPSFTPTTAPTHSPTSAPVISEMFGLERKELITMSTILAVAFLLLLFCISCCLYRRIKRLRQKQFKLEQAKHKYTHFLTNPMVVSINIGVYMNKNDLSLEDVEINEHCDDLTGIYRDYENIQAMCKKYNYDLYPKHLKITWTSDELKDSLEQYAKIFSDNIIQQQTTNHTHAVSAINSLKNNINYDSLFVVVSSHGLNKKIITSDYKLIGQSAIYRLFAYENVRTVPRLFVFDCCDGDKYKDTYHVGDDTDEEHKSKTLAIDEGEFEFDSRNEWKINNPDYKLCIINAANEGYVSKMTTIDGSYLIYNLVKKMMENVDNKKEFFLGEIIDEIDDKLHSDGKQKIIAVFNNHTRYLKFEINNNGNDISENKQEEDTMEQIPTDVPKNVAYSSETVHSMDIETKINSNCEKENRTCIVSVEMDVRSNNNECSQTKHKLKLHYGNRYDSLHYGTDDEEV